VSLGKRENLKCLQSNCHNHKQCFSTRKYLLIHPSYLRRIKV
jgi:hypothetical protein